MQDNVTFTTTGTKQVVVIRGYVTGRIEEAIRAAVNQKMKINMGAMTEGDKPALETDATIMDAGNRVALEMMVISVDGSSDGVVDKVLDMPAADYHEVLDKINAITKPSKAEKKSGSENSPSSPSSPSAPGVPAAPVG